MKLSKIEKKLKYFEVQTNTSRDKQILETLLTEQALSEVNVSRFEMAFKAAIFVIAAGILIMSTLWLTQTTKVHEQGNAVSFKSQTTSELTTIMSLDRAFYRGGIQAVENQLDQAEKQMTSQPNEPFTVEQWMHELLNDC